MLNTALLIGLFALFNRMRGAIGFKPLTCIGCGLAAALYVLDTHNYNCLLAILAGVIVANGLLLWCAPGWGKYFAVFHGRDDVSETEIQAIDDIGYWLMPCYIDRANYVAPGTSRNRIRGFITMTLRGLFILPMVVGLALLAAAAEHNAWSDWSGFYALPLAFLQGAVYSVGNLVPEKYAVPLAEALMGVVLAFMVIIAI